MALAAALLPALLGASAAPSSTPGAEPAASGIADAIIEDRRLPAPEPAFDAATAPALRRAVVADLVPRLGPVVGYKAALTSAAAQQHMGVSQPLLGSLLRDMLLPGPVLRVSRPVLVEADLLVRVGDAAINRARTRAEALAGLDAVLPFIELPALRFDGAPSAALLEAGNTGAWRGRAGPPLPLTASAQWLSRLETFSVTLQGADGTVLGSGRGADLLGHPLDVVLWMVQAVRAEGQHLLPGDLLSLGSLTAPTPVQAPARLRVRYEGLAEAGPLDLRLELREAVTP